MTYVPLHVHTHYSLLDGVATPREYVARAVELGMPALAITDHGTIAGHREFVRECEAAGIKPILGVEAYVCDDINDTRPNKERVPGDKLYYHMVLLARTQEGLVNLQHLMRKAWEDGFHYKPRIDWSMLSAHGKGIIATSGCLSGPLAKYIENERVEEAHEYLNTMAGIFDQFYVEIMPHNPPEMNRELMRYANYAGVPVIATPDCHHATPDQKALNEIALILNTGAKAVKGAKLEDAPLEVMDKLNHFYGADRQMSFNSFDIHLLSNDEMTAGLPYIDEIADVLENTKLVADSVESYELPYGLDLLPVDYKTDPFKRLQTLARKGLEARGLYSEVYAERLDEELQIIQEKNFASYFLIVNNMVDWARRHDILVGPGRGSAAGSLLCYALGITNIDPIEHGLLFFRFINPDRNDMPDIDVDFQDNRREEVKQYLKRRYGNTAGIATWLTWQDKGVVRDVARAFRVPLGDVNKALKNVGTWEQFVTDRDIAWFRDKYPEVVKYGAELRGRIRGSGIHAAGVVVCRDDIANYAPIEMRKDTRNKDNAVVIGADKDEAERIGLIKIDALGLSTLTVLKHFADITGVTLDDVPMDDPAVYADLAAGHTTGVFQLGEHAYTKLVKELKPQTFDDLAASNALVRPGAMNTIGQAYIDRRLGKRPVSKLHPIYDEITRETYGLVIYQEQVMQLCVQLGGMSMSEADRVRKIIGKKKDPHEFDQFRDKFVEGASKYIDPAAAASLWQSFEAHADYSFNKSHAVAYSTLSYWTAWAKHYYPLAYMYALINNEPKQQKRSYLFIEARRLNVPILNPHVDKSGVGIQIEGDALRLGLEDVKYVGTKVASAIVLGRPYGNYMNWKHYVDNTPSINSRAFSVLDTVGAMDFDEVDRPADEDKLYEYLGIPNFKVDEAWRFDDIADYEEHGAYVFNAIVSNIKRGNGWALVDFIDSTGSCGLFTDENTELVEGNGYVIVVAGNNLVDAQQQPDAALDNYLRNSYNGNGQYIVARRPRTTKTGKRIINVVYANGHGLQHGMVFSKSYAKGLNRLRPGAEVNYKIGRLNDGTKVFNF